MVFSAQKVKKAIENTQSICNNILLQHLYHYKQTSKYITNVFFLNFFADSDLMQTAINYERCAEILCQSSMLTKNTRKPR